MGATESQPCDSLLQSYVKCMKVHQGQRPDPYEPEWCEGDKEAYRECREQLKDQAKDQAYGGGGGNEGGGGATAASACK